MVFSTGCLTPQHYTSCRAIPPSLQQNWAPNTDGASCQFRALIETDTPYTTGALIAEPKQVKARLGVAVERKPFESLSQPLAFID
jgi:hypothetical protein